MQHWKYQFEVIKEELAALGKISLDRGKTLTKSGDDRHQTVFSIKKNDKGEIERYRARLVAIGHQQTPGVDYFHTYSLVASQFVYSWHCAVSEAIMCRNMI
ncbi:unnamed protein product [Albugo candida]|uniref:Reverse transcriptase Ty1/copia-type domain-containing protein n=1 Tax=Albugo candida TaxID=65357 RepID=A0A024GSV5_9STRA|nr:unnamed protein product [Albugo candida]|eukprot:CCI49414.1 unnamed protein product [Albugo candida]